MARQETDLIFVDKNTTDVIRVPQPQVEPQGITLRAKEINARGEWNTTTMPLPQDGIWLDRQLKVMALKAGPMSDQPIGIILCAVLYAEETGLSAVLGDLYIVNGRIATTADAKIRHAMSSGLVNGFKVSITDGPMIEIPYQVRGQRKEWKGPNYHCTVTVNVKGWSEPHIYEADFDEWFNGANAAWQERPKYMFRKNCLSKALAEVAPLGVDADDAPVPANLEQAQAIVSQLIESTKKADRIKEKENE